MKTLHTEISVDAPPAVVWAALVDLPRHQEWNPFIVEAEGEVRVGGPLRLRMTPPGGRTSTLRPRVTELVPDDVLEWLGRVGPRGLFAGRHRFELHATETGTRLVQHETFTGVLVPLLARSLDGRTLPGLVAMNEALKSRSERAAQAG